MTAAGSDFDTARLRLALLGGFELRDACGDLIRLQSNKVMLLVAILALAPNRQMSRDRLVSLLWSDRAEPQGRASLRQALWELRSALSGREPQLLCTDGELVALNAPAVTIDVERFERLAAESTPAALQEATKLYRGQLLDGVRARDGACEAFLLAERERLRDLALSAQDRLLEYEMARSPPERAIETARRLIALDPCHERAHRALMQLWARQGRYDLAIRQYRACHEVLRRELDIAPQPETKQLVDDIRRGDVLATSQPKPATAPTTAQVEEQAGAVAARSALQRRQVRRTAAAVLAACIVALLGGLYLAVSPPGAGTVASSAEPGLATRPTPAVAVVALEAFDADASSIEVARRLGSDLLTELSRSGRLSVIEASGDPSEGLEAAQYLVGGATYGEGNDVRLHIKLVGSGSARRIWTEHYEMGSDGLSVWDDGGGPALDVYAALLAHATAKQETDSAQAAAAFLRGWHHHRRHEFEADRLALRAFSEALAHDPGYGRAHAALAALYWRCWLHRCGEGRHLGLSTWGGAWDRAEHHLELAMESPTSLAHQVASRMLLLQGRHDEALDEAARALALDPSDADAVATLAEIRTISGAPLEALTELQRIQGTDLERSQLYPRALGRALFATGSFAEAAVALERAVALRPGDKAALELLTASYGHLGRAEEAAGAAAALTRLVQRYWGGPKYDYRIAMAEYEAATQLPGDRALLLDGLRLAGIPD
jgi:DNA-binding SARP family transcriptional activator/TolB-like protein